MKPVVLIILDGWGIAPNSSGNAIAIAKTPNYDRMLDVYPSTQLHASGRFVGLKPGEAGNSEAGHINLGAGRLVQQDKVYINESIYNGTFFRNSAFLKAIEFVKERNSQLHLMGLLSNGDSAHAEQDHLEALMLMAKQQNLKQVYLHLFLDGRDTYQKAALSLMEKFEKVISNLGIGHIVTVSGRYYAMDRGNNWNRTGLAYQAMVNRQGEHAKSAIQAIKFNYRKGVTDEFIKPTVVNNGHIKEGDALIFFNLRSDRARQLTKAFVLPKDCDSTKYNCQLFTNFKNLHLVTMTDYGSDLPVNVAYPARRILNNLSHYLGKYPHMRQIYLAEREKFAHVTYFFHGGDALPERNEVRQRFESKDVKTFDLAPTMSSKEITDSIIDNLNKKKFSLVVANYANADMLGHTGDFDAVVRGIEFLDQEFGRLFDATKKNGASLLITADHGNAEQMLDPDSGEPDTTHTANKVPFILADESYRQLNLKTGILSDVSPTILRIMELEKPMEMTGKSLIV